MILSLSLPLLFSLVYHQQWRTHAHIYMSNNLIFIFIIDGNDDNVDDAVY
jgi:hypothetical protein